jgi:hypothetical protein
MYVFVDTEFTDFKNMQMISLGLVSEDGKHEFYVEITDYDLNARSQFVNDVVVPLLDLPKYGMLYSEAATKLKDWVDSLPTQQVIFVVDYGGDWNLLGAMLFSNMPQKSVIAHILHSAFLNALNERGFIGEAHARAFRTLHASMEDYYLIDNRQHHALVDAKANRTAWVKAFKEVQ